MTGITNRGQDTKHLDKPFDIILATDIMYLESEVDNLIKTIKDISHSKSAIYFAYGRNRSAETKFRDTLETQGFQIETVSCSLTKFEVLDSE